MKNGKIIALANNKGGVSKSSAGCLLAIAYAQINLKVLVIDLDPQGNASSALTGMEDEARDKMTAKIEDVFMAILNPDMLQISFNATLIKKTLHDNIHLLPANQIMDLGIKENEIGTNALKKIIKFLDLRSQYDVIIIDTPPGFSFLSMAGVLASDGVVVPMSDGPFSVSGLSRLKALLKAAQVMDLDNTSGQFAEVKTIFFSNVKTRSKAMKESTKKLKVLFPDIKIKTYIRECSKVKECQGNSTNVFDLKGKNIDRLTKDYTSLRSEISEAIGINEGAVCLA